MEFRYHVETGPDGIRWLSVEPLMEDIVQSIDQLMKIDVSSLSDDNKQIMDLKILGLRTVHEFLGSIITADNLKKMKGNTNGQSQQEETQNIVH